MFASETEKDDVNEDRGGIVSVDIRVVGSGLDTGMISRIAIALN